MGLCDRARPILLMNTFLVLREVLHGPKHHLLTHSLWLTTPSPIPISPHYPRYHYDFFKSLLIPFCLHCAIPDHIYAPLLLDSWAKSNLGSQLTYIVGLSFLRWVILNRDSMRSLFSLSPHDFSIPFFFPFSHIYSKLVVG